MPKKYDKATRERAVRMLAEQAGEYESVAAACAAVGSRLGISKETLRGWARQAQIDARAEPGLTSSEREEIRESPAAL